VRRARPPAPSSSPLPESLTRAEPTPPCCSGEARTEAPDLFTARHALEERNKDERGEPQHELPSLRASSACYEAVCVILSDDNNAEQGLAAARRVLRSVLAHGGSGEMINVAVQLASLVGAALERIAIQEGLAVTDLTDLCFLE
jgi:hypothetical protein